MAEQTYTIRYVADNQASSVIQTVANAVKKLAAGAIESTDDVQRLTKIIGNAATNLQAMATAVKSVGSTGSAVQPIAEAMVQLTAKTTEAQKRVVSLEGSIIKLSSHAAGVAKVADQFARIGASSSTAAADSSKLQAQLAKIGAAQLNVAKLADQLLRVKVSADQAAQHAREASKGFADLGSHTGDINGLKTAVEGVQRKTYGLKMNLEEAGSAAKKLGAAGQGLGGLGAQIQTATGPASKLKSAIGGIGAKLRASSLGSAKLGTSLDSLFARIAVAHQLREAIEGIGNAIKDARATDTDGAKSNLKIRDTYRELANLQGKPEPDNAVIGGALRFRVATGLADGEANEALRRFEGGLPHALERGNITGNSTTGLAGDFFREATTTGLRTGVKGGTTGLLAAKLAQTDKIDSVDQGVAQYGAIVDTFNRGDGDVDKLIDSMIKKSGGMVGQGLPFKTLGEYAAAQSTASLNASPSVSGTRVNQAARALDRFGDRASEGGKPKEGDALKAMDIKATMPFNERIAILKTKLAHEPNKNLALSEMGFDNSQERSSLLQFVNNDDVLQSETKTVRESVDPKNIGAKSAAIRKQNAAFMSSDDAQFRVANAEKDSADFVRFTKNEATEVSRKKAEAKLQRDGELDNTASNIDDAMADNPIVRSVPAVGRKWLQSNTFGLLGGDTPTDDLPVWMGGKPNRQRRIDAETERQSKQAALRSGVNADAAIFNASAYSVTTPEDRLPAVAEATRRQGGSPFASSEGSDAALKMLVREAEQQTKLLQSLANGQAKPEFLPLQPRIK